MANNHSALLSIIIVNWNAGQQLRDCVSTIAIARQVGFQLSSVTIVDNGSTDGSLDDVDQLGVPVRILRNKENRGFAAACNQGAAGSTADYLLFLNPDTRLFEDSLLAPIAFMQHAGSAEVGICGVQLVDEKGNPSTSAARFPTLRVMLGKILWLERWLPSIFPPHLINSPNSPGGNYVDQVSGAFFLIREEVFELCGGFDERFFVYFEEVDLSLKAKQLGYSSYLLAKASAYHRGGGCSERVKVARLFYSLRSRILYAQKHYSRSEFVVLVLLTGIELPLRLAQGLLRASWADVNNTLVAYTRLVTELVRRA